MALQISGVTIVDNSQNLNITGVSSFTSGPVLIGGGTSTGTASQPLQVNGGVYIAGDINGVGLGIGITNTAYPLEIRSTTGATNPAIRIYPSTTTRAAGIVYANNAGSNFYTGLLNINGGLGSITGQTPYGAVVGNSAGTTPLLFVTNNTEALRIDSSGNVGIGTTNPTAKLVCNGQIQVTATGTPTSGAGLEISYGQISASRTAMQSYNRTGSAYLGADYDALDYRFYISGSQKVTIDTSGNLGVGQASPGAKLDVTGNIRLSAANPNIEFNNGGGMVYSPAANTIAFASGGGPGAPQEKARIDSSGRLGIGITTPNLGSPSLYVQGSQSTNGLVNFGNNTNSADVNHGIINLINTATGAAGNDARIMFTFRQAGLSSGLDPMASIGAVKETNDYAAAIQFNTRSASATYSEKVRIDSSGRLGISTTSPGYTLDVVSTDQTEGVAARLRAASSFASAGLQFTNNAATAEWSRLEGSSNGLRIRSSIFLQDATAPYTTAAAGQIASKTSSATAYSHFVLGNATQGYLYVNVADAYAWNAGSSVLLVGKNTGTGRSINAAGTINASGADYAEYMVKADDFILAKGDICGITTNGLLTNVFADAISFVVKSTDPSYVGGDSWGTEDVVGPKPDMNDTEAYAEWQENFETFRARVDRIAFAGQVPVNVTEATPGQYIVPVAKDDGGITGVAKNEADLTLPEYMRAVGKVIATEDDGRARIIVKVS